MNANGYVYYARVGKHIKIGWASDVRSRMKNYPPETQLLAVEPGTLATEQERLSQFKDALEWGNEWFTPTPAIGAHVSAVRKQYGAPTVHEYSFQRKGVEAISGRAETWLTIQESADVLKVSTKTVRRWISDGLIDARRFGKRLIRVDVESVNTAGRPLQYMARSVENA